MFRSMQNPSFFHPHCPTFPILFNSPSSLTLDQNLNSPRLRARRTSFKSLDRILEIKAMSNQSLHVQDPALHEPDGARPGVGVAVLELEVDFLGAEAHEGDLDVGFADANDEDLAAKFDGVDLFEFVNEPGFLQCGWGKLC